MKPPLDEARLDAIVRNLRNNVATQVAHATMRFGVRTLRRFSRGGETPAAHRPERVKPDLLMPRALAAHHQRPHSGQCVLHVLGLALEGDVLAELEGGIGVPGEFRRQRDLGVELQPDDRAPPLTAQEPGAAPVRRGTLQGVPHQVLQLRPEPGVEGQPPVRIHSDERLAHRDHPPLLRPRLARVRVADDALTVDRRPAVAAAPQPLEQRVAAEALEAPLDLRLAELSRQLVLGLVSPGGVRRLVGRHVLPAELHGQHRRRERREQAAASAHVDLEGVPHRLGQGRRLAPVEPDRRHRHTGKGVR